MGRLSSKELAAAAEAAAAAAAERERAKEKPDQYGVVHGRERDVHGFRLAVPAADYAAAHQHARLRAVVQRRTWAAWGRAAAATAQPSEAVRALRSTCAAVGIPASHRPQLWLCLSGAADLYATAPRSYAELARPPALSAARVKDAVAAAAGGARATAAAARELEWERQIDLDLGRTFPEHAEFSEGGGAGQAMLRRVLLAHCRRNPQLGYTQSLNFLAAMLLIAVPPDGVSLLLPPMNAVADAPPGGRRRKPPPARPPPASPATRERVAGLGAAGMWHSRWVPSAMGLRAAAVAAAAIGGGGFGGGGHHGGGWRAAHLTREEAAFWLLCVLTEELNADYYTSDLVGVQVDVALLDELASAHPSLRAAWEAIEASGFQLQLVSQQWLLLAFVGALPTETTFRVWDLLFVAGSPALLAASLALLRTLAGPLAAGGADFERVYAQLKCVHAAVLDADAFLRRTLVELRALPPQTLRRMRAPHRERIAADLAASAAPMPEEYAARKLARARGVRAVARRAGGGGARGGCGDCAPRRRRWGVGALLAVAVAVLVAAAAARAAARARRRRSRRRRRRWWSSRGAAAVARASRAGARSWSPRAQGPRARCGE